MLGQLRAAALQEHALLAGFGQGAHGVRADEAQAAGHENHGSSFVWSLIVSGADDQARRKLADVSTAPALGYLLKHAHLRFATLTDEALEPFGIDGKDFGAAGAGSSRADVAAGSGADAEDRPDHDGGPAGRSRAQGHRQPSTRSDRPAEERRRADRIGAGGF